MITEKYKLFAWLPNLILYLCLLTGLLILFGNDIYLLLKRLSVRHRLKNLPSQKKNPVYAFLGKLASSALGRDIRGESAALAEICLMALTFLTASRSFSFAISLTVALMIGALPLLLLFAKLQASRSRGSREGLSFVSELSRQYRIRKKNIYEALASCCETAENYPVCGKHAYKLLVHLQDASGQSNIRSAIDQFSFALGTVWGNMLSGSIRLCVEKGSDISAGLDDIVVQLEKANTRAEERRRLNSESVRMTVFLVPLLYVGTLFLSGKYLDIPAKDLFRNQFFTPEGLMFFLVILFLFVLNLICISLVSNTGSDI